MNIISWNVNGLRSVERKGFSNWATDVEADFICLQELKLQNEQIPQGVINLPYYQYYNFAYKKGYSGVGIFTKYQPNRIINEVGLDRFDNEGRIIGLEYPNLIIFNLYLPHGGRQKENLSYKLDCYQALFRYLTKIHSDNIVLTGDFNIAHTELDLARPKQNYNNIMFTLEERSQIDCLLRLGFFDTFRSLHPENKEYTWWPWIKTARDNNIGWRLDYLFCSKSLQPSLTDSIIHKEISGSDHCPIQSTFSFSLN